MNTDKIVEIMLKEQEKLQERPNPIKEEMENIQPYSWMDEGCKQALSSKLSEDEMRKIDECARSNMAGQKFMMKSMYDAFKKFRERRKEKEYWHEQYWQLATDCLIQLFDFDQDKAKTEIKELKERLDNLLDDDLTYHKEACYVACNIMGVKELTEEQRQKYFKMREKYEV